MHSWNNVIERPRLLYLGFGTTFHIIWGLAYTNKRNAVHFTRLTNKLLSEGFLYVAQKEPFFLERLRPCAAQLQKLLVEVRVVVLAGIAD
jgi:hypothetical protein